MEQNNSSPLFNEQGMVTGSPPLSDDQNTQATATPDLSSQFLMTVEEANDADAVNEKYSMAANLRKIGIEPFPDLGADDRGVTLASMSAGPADSSITNDMTKGIFIGANKGANEMLDAAAFIAGAPVELAKNVINVGLEAVGMEPVKNAFGDIDSMKSMMDTYKGFVNDLIPMPDAIVDWAGQPYDNKLLGDLTAGITQFGVAGFPAAKMVKAMTTYNPVARGFIWGAIADFTAFNPDDPTLTNAITKHLEMAPPEERNAVLQAFLSQIEKYDTDGELTKRAKAALEGGIIGGVVEAAIRTAKFIPFGQIIDGTKRAIGRAGAAADARIAEREADNSVTLYSGYDPTDAIDAALSYAGRKARKSGQLVGAPPGIKSQKALEALQRNLEAAAKEGEPGRFWYERSGKAILDAVGGNKAEAERLVQAIGITSLNTPVADNFAYALQAYLQHKAGKQIKTGRFPKAMSKRLQKVFDGEDWEGRKTNNFYINLMREIDPSKVQGVTVDLWMMRAFGFKNTDGTPYNKTPTDAQYTFVEEETKRIAEKLGWEPQQVQAAIWVANKAQEEGIEVSKAAFDYSTALLNNKAQISWESIPGRTGNHMREMFDAPYEVQQEYHVAVSKAFLDRNGNDELAKELGIPTPGDFEAPGYFEGKVSPGTQTELAVPREYGGPKYGAVEPAALELMEAYAAVRGIVMKQDGVGFHRPFYKATKQDSQGVMIDIGRQFTERETKELGRIMTELSGHGDYAPIAAPGGVRLVNFAFARRNPDGSPAMEGTWFSDDMLRTNKEFHKLVREAVEKLDLDDDVGVNLGTFNAQEGYVGNDWSVNKNGEDYFRDTSFSGSPDLQRKVRFLITKFSTRIDEIDRDFAERYGFTRNTDLNQEFRQTDQ